MAARRGAIAMGSTSGTRSSRRTQQIAPPQRGCARRDWAGRADRSRCSSRRGAAAGSALNSKVDTPAMTSVTKAASRASPSSSHAHKASATAASTSSAITPAAPTSDALPPPHESRRRRGVDVGHRHAEHQRHAGFVNLAAPAAHRQRMRELMHQLDRHVQQRSEQHETRRREPARAHAPTARARAAVSIASSSAIASSQTTNAGAREQRSAPIRWSRRSARLGSTSGRRQASRLRPDVAAARRSRFCSTSSNSAVAAELQQLGIAQLCQHVDDLVLGRRIAGAARAASPTAAASSSCRRAARPIA